MNRIQLEKYIEETYNSASEHPWAPDTMHAVFRHSSNRKWFAVIMDIPKVKLGIRDDGMITVVNLKCDPIMTGSLIQEEGIYPAYHMNKTNWVSVLIDDKTDEEKLNFLLDLSFNMTSGKRYVTEKRRGAY